MNPKKLQDLSEDVRRIEIIEISKSANHDAIEHLLNSYSSETDENKRHIVRAYGNIGGLKLEAELLLLLSTEEGIILGDICKSIGQLGLSSAKEKIRTLQEHELSWVKQNATWTLKRFDNNRNL